jgi:HlyD family secretion protein
VGALVPLGDGGTGVFRLRDGKARLQPVELGGRNGSEAWVRSGLKAGETVIVYPPPAVSDGKRVQRRQP